METTEFRRMTLPELRMVLGWAAEEGWNPNPDDAEAFHASDPRGFFVATRGGMPVASISVVNHSDTFAFLGLYICRPEFRGQGIGIGLWTHALAHAGNRTVGLEGVLDQQANYRKSGFSTVGETHRFEGYAEGESNSAIRPFESNDLDNLATLDASANGFEKRRFLAGWLPEDGTRRTLVAEDSGGLRGYATVRKCLQGHKIGPLVAKDTETAIGLLQAAAKASGGDIVVDVPDDQADLTAHCRALGLSSSFSTARMYRGEPPRSDGARRLIATLELG